MRSKENACPNIEIKRLRSRSGWSRRELAAQLGVTPLTVQRWELGYTTPNEVQATKIFELFLATSVRVAGLTHKGKDLGVKIFMYVMPMEHEPAHFHIVRGQEKCICYIHNLNTKPVLKDSNLIISWAAKNKEALLLNWQKCMSGMKPNKISGEV